MVKLEIEFVSIKPGAFTMGAVGVLQENYPVIPAEITKPFKIAKYPITQTQWFAVMNSRPWLEFDIPDNANFPAVGISYLAAQAFSEQASILTKQRLSLPTEVQWEYCCRAGTQTKFFWGNPSDFASYAWCVESPGPRSVREVGLLKPNAWGLHDMAGNVAEWVRDRCDTDGPMLSKRHYPKKSKISLLSGASMESVAGAHSTTLMLQCIRQVKTSCL